MNNQRHSFKKQFGQNFLRSGKYVDKVLEPLNLAEGDTVIEVGPGDGMVTQKVLNAGAKIICIEVDYDLLARLLQKFSDNQNFILEHSDILEVNLPKLLQTYGITGKIKVAGSLPYNISKQIIRLFLDFHFSSKDVQIDKMSFIVQDEVAKAYAAKPPKTTLLSVQTSLMANVRKLESIPASQFVPKPKVDGAILFLQPLEQNKLTPQLSTLLKNAFASPRKTLMNNLKNYRDFNAEKLKALGVSEFARASELAIDDWEKLL